MYLELLRLVSLNLNNKDWLNFKLVCHAFNNSTLLFSRDISSRKLINKFKKYLKIPKTDRIINKVNILMKNNNSIIIYQNSCGVDYFYVILFDPTNMINICDFIREPKLNIRLINSFIVPKDFIQKYFKIKNELQNSIYGLNTICKFEFDNFDVYRFNGSFNKDILLNYCQNKK